jgi:tRNA-2-methylthio-N6-dimethylallyladenosine synthase
MNDVGVPLRRFVIETWGCQMNVHDSEKLAGLLGGLGYSRASRPEDADLILLNTCSVREKPASKVFDRLGTLRRLKQQRPDLILGVCGCVAQAEGEAIFRRAPYVDLVMGPRNIVQVGALIEQARRDGRSISLARDDQTMMFPTSTTARTPGPRAYVTVMEGCNKACTYCIVPFTRGREVYRPAADILAEAQELTRQGYPEIELLGQNVNAYHHGDVDFAGLLHQVDRLPGLRRIRFTTSHPGHLKRPIMEAMRDVPSVCNHLHLPAQSGSDRVLKAMNRGYTHSVYLSKIDQLRGLVPDIAFSTDLIVGFPGEDDEDFEATLALVREVEFDQIYAFVYSPRPGTAAATLEGIVPRQVAEDRLQALLALHDGIRLRRNHQLVGSVFEVLVDGPSPAGKATVKGRTRCNRIVHLPERVAEHRVFVDARIVRAHAHSLSGVPVDEASPVA